MMATLLSLPYEIVNEIFKLLDTRSQLRFRQTCRVCHDRLMINDLSTHNFKDFDVKFLKNITMDVLMQHPNITSLTLYDIAKVDNILFLDQLKNLSFLRNDQTCRIICNTKCTKKTCKFINQDIIENKEECTHTLKYSKIDNENSIIRQPIFPLNNLTKLDLSGNSHFYDLNKLINLKILILSSCELMTDESIKDLINLEELKISDRSTQISRVNHLINLKKLIIPSNDKIKILAGLNQLDTLDVSAKDVRYPSAIDNESLKPLINLKHLIVTGNSLVTDINHMINLESLDASKGMSGCGSHVDGHCGLSDSGIIGLKKLKSLKIYNNEKITDVSTFYDLEHLDITCNDAVVNSISNLFNLKVLKALYLKKLEDHHLKNLTELIKLNISGSELITNIDTLTKLEKLTIYKCPNITNINKLTNLKQLNCNHSNLGDDGIKDLRNIEKLSCANSLNITNVNHLKKLIDLYAYGDCGINDDGIKELKNLKILNMSSNDKITDINHLVNLEELHVRDFRPKIKSTGFLKCINIKYLDISESKIKYIGHLKNLEKLRAVWSMQLTGIGFKKLTKLRWADLHGTKISQETIDYIQKTYGIIFGHFRF